MRGRVLRGDGLAHGASGIDEVRVGGECEGHYAVAEPGT